jgi:hypothetical protein
VENVTRVAATIPAAADNQTHELVFIVESPE